jgi:hypothetical protein
MSAIGRVISIETDSISPTVYAMLHHPLLWFSTQTRVLMALGIVFLMTVKPDLIGSLLTIGIAGLLGFASAVSIGAREQAQEAPVTSGDESTTPIAL